MCFWKRITEKQQNLFPCWPVIFPDQVPHWKSWDCRTTNTLEQLLVMSVVFKTFRPVDGDYGYWTFVQAKPDVKVLCIILCCFVSSTLACLFFDISLSHLAKAILLTVSLASCSYTYPRTFFKHPLRPLISSPLTMIFLHTVLSQVPLISPWNCSLETTGLKNPTLNSLWRQAQAQQHHRNRLKPTCSVPRRRLHHTTTHCWNSEVNSYILV